VAAPRHHGDTPGRRLGRISQGASRCLSPLPSGDGMCLSLECFALDMTLYCATYRFHYGEWPTRLELGPDAVRALKPRLSEANFARLRELFDLVTLASDPDDPRSRVLIRFSGPPGAVPVPDGPGFPALKTKAELDAWNRCEAETRARLHITS
jgi:hypothetical protein